MLGWMYVVVSGYQPEGVGSYDWVVAVYDMIQLYHIKSDVVTAGW